MLGLRLTFGYIPRNIKKESLHIHYTLMMQISFISYKYFSNDRSLCLYLYDKRFTYTSLYHAI